MIIGVISDAHGNIYGLKKCIELLEATDVQKIYFLGDAVNYFSKSKEVLGYLKAKKVECIKGNHEILILEEREVSQKKNEIYNIDLTIKNLSKENYLYLKSWQSHLELSLSGFKILMVHGSPFDYLCGYVYPDSNFENILSLSLVFTY